MDGGINNKENYMWEKIKKFFGFAEDEKCESSGSACSGGCVDAITENGEFLPSEGLSAAPAKKVKKAAPKRRSKRARK